tara:strand:- start:2524 stop:2958 length:435 start_codon:yes stop_codon:yes gene_type:complete
MLDATFFRRIGPNVRDRYRKHIFQDAKDVFGKPFKAYTSKYGQAKRANKFKRQTSQYAGTNAPVLTSDLLRDYSLIKTASRGFQIGWTTLGARVEWLKKMGRVLTSKSQPMPDGVIKYLNNEAHSYIKKRLGPNKTTTYRIGKK